VSDTQFRFAVSVLSAALLILMSAASFSMPRSVPAYLITGYVFAMLLNVLAPHLVASIAMGKYMPGTATAVLNSICLSEGYFSTAHSLTAMSSHARSLGVGRW